MESCLSDGELADALFILRFEMHLEIGHCLIDLGLDTPHVTGSCEDASCFKH